MRFLSVHPGRVVIFGIFDDRAGTEEVVLVTKLDAEDEKECALIVDRFRQHVTENSAIALRQVYVVDSRWILKTSSGKVARSANREEFLMEAGFR